MSLAGSQAGPPSSWRPSWSSDRGLTPAFRLLVLTLSDGVREHSPPSLGAVPSLCPVHAACFMSSQVPGAGCRVSGRGLQSAVPAGRAPRAPAPGAFPTRGQSAHSPLGPARPRRSRRVDTELPWGRAVALGRCRSCAICGDRSCDQAVLGKLPVASLQRERGPAHKEQEAGEEFSVLSA